MIVYERTTILVYPGEHTIDNRPGFAIKPSSSGNPNVPTVVSPGGSPKQHQIQTFYH